MHLTAGHAPDGRQFESLYESLDPDNVLASAALDKGSDADRIRERLAYDGSTAVIPPLPTRCGRLPFDKELYRGRNRIERFFNKLKAVPPPGHALRQASQNLLCGRPLRRSLPHYQKFVNTT